MPASKNIPRLDLQATCLSSDMPASKTAPRLDSQDLVGSETKDQLLAFTGPQEDLETWYLAEKAHLSGELQVFEVSEDPPWRCVSFPNVSPRPQEVQALSETVLAKFQDESTYYNMLWQNAVFLASSPAFSEWADDGGMDFHPRSRRNAVVSCTLPWQSEIDLHRIRAFMWRCKARLDEIFQVDEQLVRLETRQLSFWTRIIMITRKIINSESWKKVICIDLQEKRREARRTRVILDTNHLGHEQDDVSAVLGDVSHRLGDFTTKASSRKLLSEAYPAKITRTMTKILEDVDWEHLLDEVAEKVANESAICQDQNKVCDPAGQQSDALSEVEPGVEPKQLDHLSSNEGDTMFSFREYRQSSNDEEEMDLNLPMVVLPMVMVDIPRAFGPGLLPGSIGNKLRALDGETQAEASDCSSAAGSCVDGSVAELQDMSQVLQMQNPTAPDGNHTTVAPDEAREGSMTRVSASSSNSDSTYSSSLVSDSSISHCSFIETSGNPTFTPQVSIGSPSLAWPISTVREDTQEGSASISSTAFIQMTPRMECRHQARSTLIQNHKAVLTLQARMRGKKQRALFQQIVKAVLRIQRWFRKISHEVVGFEDEAQESPELVDESVVSSRSDSRCVVGAVPPSVRRSSYSPLRVSRSNWGHALDCQAAATCLPSSWTIRRPPQFAEILVTSPELDAVDVFQQVPVLRSARRDAVEPFFKDESNHSCEEKQRRLAAACGSASRTRLTRDARRPPQFAEIVGASPEVNATLVQRVPVLDFAQPDVAEPFFQDESSRSREERERRLSAACGIASKFTLKRKMIREDSSWILQGGSRDAHT